MTFKIRDTIVRLAEIGADMVDANENRKASPEEVLQDLERVAQELESIMASIPAQENSEPEAPVAQPPNPSQVAKLEKEVATLTAKLTLQDKEKIATRYAELFDQNKYAEKYDEVMNSEDSNSVWTAKIEAIEKFANESDGTPVRHASSQSFSYQKTAKLAKRLGSTEHMRSL